MADHNETKEDLLKQLADLKLEYESLKGLYEHDIAERRKAEVALKESELKYRLIFEYSPMGILSFDENGVIVACNDYFIKIIGYTREGLIGLNMLELPDKKLVAIIQKTLNSSVSVYEDIYHSVNVEKSTPIRALFVPIDISDGGIHGGLGIVEDITDYKHAEEELRKLSQAVQQSPASVIITGVDGNIEYVNPKTSEITGYSLEELIGQNPRILNSGELPKEEYKILWDKISSGKEWRGKFHNKKKNGELYWESASISPILDEKGRVIHFLAVKEDITEKKETINELIKAKNEAESANKLKDAFIANISHEIRTPLNGILGIASLMQESYALYATEKDQQFSVSIERSSKRLINTVDKILNFSLLQIGDFPVNKTSISLSYVLQTLVYEFSPAAAVKSLKIEFKSAIEDDVLIADDDALKTAFGNLIENAIKFTDSGFVKIVLYRDDQGIICVDISDTGTGISEEYLQNLFEPYSQEATGYSRPYEGLGLGLALAKKLLNLNKGTITVKSKKGEGSVFTIRFEENFKIQQGNIALTKERKDIQFAKVITDRKPEILVVEDDVVNQLFIEAILHKEYNVEIAADAAEALNLFTSRSFDLILMDISLKKGINGLELTQIIRSGKENPNVPIIAVTGHAFPDDYRKAIEAGCNDYIVKPFKSFQLLDKIRAISVKDKLF
jgi:PAS domain S-box-containing protein